ncbi:MAG: M81 family metallopeptidase [Bryobacterales bacterium]|nr:M81 family metallopeptidase [Bryobacterales bacterium]
MAVRAFLLFLIGLTAFSQTRPLVGVAGFMHESNSFFASKTTLEDYRIEEPGTDSEVFQRWANASTEVSGYIAGAKEAGLEIYPTMIANATPKGPLTNECFNAIMGRIIAKLDKAPRKLSGLLLALHGAMVVEGYPHGDAEIVARLRKHFGPGFPIFVTHDYHANVSPEIVRDSTVLITYKQNPHLDTKDRGVQAARLLGRTLKGEIKPVQAIVKPPMIYNIIFQNTYAEPYKPIREASEKLERENPKVLAASVPGGYQYGDVPYVGPSAIVVTNGDLNLARTEAKRLADMLWATRERIRLNLPDAAEAVRRAKAAKKFPVALFDTGDNIGGGSAGDATFLLDELIKQKAEAWVVVIADAAAVDAAKKAGINGAFDMAVGGKTDDKHGKPVRVRGRVRSLHDGTYIESAVRHGGGRYWDNGETAVILVDGSTRDLPNYLVLTKRRSSPNSLNQIISLGIDPRQMHILTAKGTIAPRAAYEPVSAEIVPVDTPGPTTVNPARFKYTRVREKLWGLQ